MKALTAKLLCLISALVLMARLLFVAFNIPSNADQAKHFAHPAESTSPTIQQQHQGDTPDSFFHPDSYAKVEIEEEKLSTADVRFIQGLLHHFAASKSQDAANNILQQWQAGSMLPLYQKYCVYLI